MKRMNKNKFTAIVTWFDGNSIKTVPMICFIDVQPLR